MAKEITQKDGNVSYEIRINGSKIKDRVEISEISIHAEINRITNATIVMGDGGAIGVVNAPFSNSEGNDFLPGNDIEIDLGYDDQRTNVFKGIIVSQRLMVKFGKSQLMISCKHKAVAMTNGRINAIFQNSKDSDAIKTIVSGYGIALKIDATKSQQPILMQYNCSDWDFTVIRAEVNDMIVITDNKGLSIKKLDLSASPSYKINSAEYVIDIDLNLSADQLTSGYKMTSWNNKEQKINEVSTTMSDDLSQGNLSGKKLSTRINKKQSNHYSSASLSEEELKSWGNALVHKSVLSKIQGTITVPGTALIQAGDLIEISRFSARFNGSALISKVYHHLKEGEWTTALDVGRPPKWQSSLPDVQEMEASGLIPATDGLQIGTVKKIDEDPGGNYRVLVNLPSFSGTGQDDGLWARLAFPYATSEAGFYFFPEIGDEVLVSFVNNDPRFPVVTASLYNNKNKPKEIPEVKNQFKSIRSRSGIEMKFDDEDKILSINTPGGNKLILDDKAKKINAEDISGNSLVMEEAGISLESPKDIKISAKGSINISATSGITMDAKSDLKADAANIQLSAKASMTAKGNASAELSASGQTTVKGAMVMIN